jgi:hypothetical protein
MYLQVPQQRTVQTIMTHIVRPALEGAGMYEDEDNDGKFPDESPVEVRYPRSKQEEQTDRGTWPWLPGTIVEQCGPDEWYVCIEVRELAVLRDGRRAPRGTVGCDLYYPCCYRDGSEIRPRTASSSAAPATRHRAGR